MGLFNRTPPAPTTDLEVVGYGGTIMSVPEDGLIIPKRESLDFLLAQIPDKKFKQFRRFEGNAAEPFIDSANADVYDIMTIVEDIRHRLKTTDRLVVLYGSDSMAILMGALGNAISEKELGDKAVIVTCSMNHTKKKDTDAVTNFTRAVCLASQDEVRGKIGLMFDQRFFGPFGIEKPQIANTFAFVTRFYRQAKYHAGRMKWEFRPDEDFDKVRGTPDKPFLLANNIHSFEVDPMTDYSQIQTLIATNRATILVGLGDGNLRSDDVSVEYLKSAAEIARGPIVVVGSASYNAEEGIEFPTRRRKGEVYQGNGGLIPRFISAGAMTRSEAKVIVSHDIAELEAKGITDPDEINDKVSFTIMTYPFRDLLSSKLKKSKRKPNK